MVRRLALTGETAFLRGKLEKGRRETVECDLQGLILSLIATISIVETGLVGGETVIRATSLITCLLSSWGWGSETLLEMNRHHAIVL